MRRLECPHCDIDIESYVPDISDWLYVNNLYTEDTHDVKCPSCKEAFVVEAFTVMDYHTVKSRDDL